MSEYRKVGRGGAGNYYSKQDIEAAAKRAEAQRDLEAQKPSQNNEGTQYNASQPKYAPSGRGGAGNLTEASSLAAATKDSIGSNPTLTEKKPPSAGYFGRGGAGNFKDNSVIEGVVPGETEMKEMTRQPDPFASSKDALREPERAHLGGDRSQDDA